MNFGLLITFQRKSERAKEATMGPAVNTTIPATVGITMRTPILLSPACKLERRGAARLPADVSSLGDTGRVTVPFPLPSPSLPLQSRRPKGPEPGCAPSGAPGAPNGFRLCKVSPSPTAAR